MEAVIAAVTPPGIGSAEVSISIDSVRSDVAAVSVVNSWRVTAVVAAVLYPKAST